MLEVFGLYEIGPGVLSRIEAAGSRETGGFRRAGVGGRENFIGCALWARGFVFLDKASFLHLIDCGSGGKGVSAEALFDDVGEGDDSIVSDVGNSVILAVGKGPGGGPRIVIPPVPRTLTGALGGLLAWVRGTRIGVGMLRAGNRLMGLFLGSGRGVGLGRPGLRRVILAEVIHARVREVDELRQ